MKKQYIYPQNMRASATLWLWSLKDFVVVVIGALFSAIVLATINAFMKSPNSENKPV